MRELRNCQDCGRYTYVGYSATFARYLCGSCARLAVGAADAGADPPTARVRHPAVRKPGHRCYRVVRHYRVRGVVRFEDIGYSFSVADAFAIAAREVGRARVLDPRGQVVSDNRQPIEDRS